MPHYTRENTAEIGQPKRAFLDGKEVKDVSEAHTDEGWLICAKRNGDGLIFDTEKLFGVVTIAPVVE